jgi:hypothetical protein
MDDALIPVVVLVSLLAFVIAAVALATSKGSYDEIGRGDLWLDEPRPQAGERYADVAAEVRQLVEAGNARRVARGEPPLDVEEEVSNRMRDL